MNLHSQSSLRPVSGFTIIELMVVVAIVSILALIALPAYQDYVVRTKVSEGLVFAGEARTSVSERYYSTNVFPTDNFAAGLASSVEYGAYDFIRRLTVSSVPRAGTVTVTFELPNTESDNKKILLLPDTSSTEIVWTCTAAPDPDGVKSTHLPGSCR